MTADDPTLTIARLCRVLECNTTAGLTLPQYRVLGLLAGGDERASLLASRVSVAKPTLTSIVDSLFDRGLVSRETPDGDRRRCDCRSPPAGRAELRKAAAEFRGVLDEVLMACDKPEAVLDALEHGPPSTRRSVGAARRCRATALGRRRSPMSAAPDDSTGKERQDLTDAAYTRPGAAGEGIGWLRRLGPFIRRYRTEVIATLVLSVVAQTLIGLLPLIQQIIVDHSILAKEHPSGPMLLVLLLTGLLGFTANYGRRYLGARVSVGIQHDLRLAIHRHLYELDFSRHDELSVGDVMSRSTADLTLIQVFFFSVPMLVANLTLLIVALSVMFVLSPILSLVIAVFVPVFAWLAIRFRNRIFPASWNDQRLSGAVAGVVDEAVTGVRVVKAFAQEDREFARLMDRSHELYQSRMRTARLNSRYSSTLQLLPMLGQLGVLGIGGWLALEGHITLGVFLAFASYMVQIITPVRILSGVLATAQQARAGSERVFELLDLQPRGHRRARCTTVVDPKGEVEFDNVTFGYADAADTVHDISLTIRPGERIGLVGASGSGKTTLALLIARFYDPRSGVVRFDGTDVRDSTLSSLRRSVNVVFEESFLFSTTIKENIAFARPDATDAEIEAAARVAQAHEFILGLSHGYDTVVGERGYTLSGGQRQRIALARAALANPAVLVLDDATSAIDASTEEAIHRSLEDELSSRTTILIAHRSSTLRLADRVLVIDEGRIVAEGTNAELWHSSHLYRELLTGPELELSRRPV